MALTADLAFVIRKKVAFCTMVHRLSGRCTVAVISDTPSDYSAYDCLGCAATLSLPALPNKCTTESEWRPGQDRMDPPGPSRGPGEEWPQAGLQGEQASLAAYLDLFSEDFLLNEALDPSTLAAVNAVQASSPGDEQAAKARKRLKQEPEVQGNALPCSGSQDNGSNDDEIDNSDIDDEPTKKSGLRRKNSTAAINKASREKARREKINDR